MTQVVICPQCGQRLRINIRKESYDRRIQISCTTCKKKFVVVARDPQGRSLRNREVETLVRLLGEMIQAAVANDTRVTEIVQAIKATGYDTTIFLDGSILLEESNETSEDRGRTPLVRDGEIAEGAFTNKDEAFMKNLRIKL